jgi:metal-dependent amidase/aminoacylase/carboxypeptidase family protein
VHYRCISPPVHNEPALTQLVADAAEDLLGRQQVVWLDQPSLGAEDFAEFLQTTEGTMFRLGVAGPAGCTPLHSSTFAPDEGCLPVGVKVLTLSLLRWGQQRQSPPPEADRPAALRP